MIATFMGLSYIFNREKPLYTVGSLGTPTSPSVRKFIGGTYAYVASGLAVSGISAYLTFRSGLAVRLLSMNPLLYFGISMGTLFFTQFMALSSPPGSAAKSAWYYAFTGGIGILSLSSLGFLPAQILIRAGVLTFGLVSSLSVVAFTAKNDAFLFLGGPLMMGLTGLICTQVLGIFFPFSGAAVSLMLYGGLTLFSGFLLYDTQKMMLKARMNTDPNPDLVASAIHIYMDIVNIFMYLVQILSNSNRKK